MPGLESDVRAGGIRVSPSELVAKAADMTPAVELLADSFRKGAINAQEFLDRFDNRGRAKAAAETEGFQLMQKTAKAAQDPRIIALRQQSEMGGLEGQIADQQFAKETREVREKAERIKMARALDELEYGIPAQMVQEYSVQFPEIVKPIYDSNNRITNADEVKKQLGHVARTQKFLSAAAELGTQFADQKVQLPDGREGVITVWKGTNQRVPQELVALSNQARVGKLTGLFGAPGAVAAPAAPAAAAPAAQALPPSAPAPVPTPSAAQATPAATPVATPAPPAPTAGGKQVPTPDQLGPIESKTTKVGETTPEGILVTGDPTRTNRLIPSEGMNKFFQLRMSVENVRDIAKAYKNIRENAPDLIGVVKGRVAGPILGEWNEWYKVLDNAVQSTVPGMARGVFGEVGVLSNADIENYKKLLPTAKTDPDVAEQILADIMKKTNRAVNLIVDSYAQAGYDTSGFADLKEVATEEEKRLAGGGSPYEYPGGPGRPSGVPARGAAPAPRGASIPRYRSILEVPQNVKVFWIEGESQPRRR